MIHLDNYKNKYVDIFLHGGVEGVGKLEKVEQEWWLKEAELLVGPGPYMVRNYVLCIKEKREEFAQFEISAESVSAIRDISDLVKRALSK